MLDGSPEGRDPNLEAVTTNARVCRFAEFENTIPLRARELPHPPDSDFGTSTVKDQIQAVKQEVRAAKLRPTEAESLRDPVRIHGGYSRG
jgi:hypothetical protein